MILALAFSWFLLSVGVFLSLIVSAYYAHVRGASTVELIAKFIAAIAAHTTVVVPSGFMAGMLMFAQAHSSGALILNTKELIVGCLFLGFEALVGWLLCSLIVGQLIGTGEPVDQRR
jgi:hypothetical protein